MKWKALILGGGGSTGEFQIGALDVAADRYNSFDMYVGVGVGSLLSSVLAQYDTLKEGYTALLDTWNSLEKTKDVFDKPFLGTGLAAAAAFASDKSWARDAIYGNTHLRGIINRSIDWNLLKGKTNWAIETTNINDGQLYTITNNEQLLKYDVNLKRAIQLSLDPNDQFFIGDKIIEFMMGAASVPIMLPPVSIFGMSFLEGGMRDLTPLELAVKAFELASKNGYTEAEFVVIDNYTHEISYEDGTLLDSGMEISMRAVKIMTVEMAQNDIFAGKSRLEKLGLPFEIRLLQPTVDYRLNPMNFDDMATRLQLRNHGISRATLLLPTPPAINTMSADVALQRTATTATTGNLVNMFTASAGNEVVTDALVQKILTEPTAIPQLPQVDPQIMAEVDTSNAKKPTNLMELLQVINDAVVGKVNIKAVGQGNAFDDILDTTGIQISMENMRNIWSPDASLLKNPSDVTNLLEFESGATIENLTDYLWSRGKALLNQPGYEKLNYLGVASTGGHGSGIRLTPIADAIKAIHLITADKSGQVIQMRVEGNDGITDRTAFESAFPNIKLIQDDHYLQSCKVAVGTIGVIYSLVIQTQPSFFLEESRTMENWDSLKQTINAKLEDPAIHSIHIWFNPYPFKGQHNCVLSEYRVVEGPERGKRGFGVTSKLAPGLGKFVGWVATHIPHTLPALLNSSLKATCNKSPVVLKCFDALNFGTPNLVAVDATNCGVPAEKVIDVADRLLQLAQDLANENLYISSPFGFRFTEKGSSYLAPQFDRRTCMIELPIVKPTPRPNDTIDKFLNLLIQDFEGRPHWGQRFNDNLNGKLKQLYPQFDTFLNVYKELNTGVFNNAFTKKVGLDS